MHGIRKGSHTQMPETFHIAEKDKKDKNIEIIDGSLYSDLISLANNQLKQREIGARIKFLKSF